MNEDSIPSGKGDNGAWKNGAKIDGYDTDNGASWQCRRHAGAENAKKSSSAGKN